MIVLLTDFGESEYVGVMKGVIETEAPGARVTDLTHQIPPQGIREAAWVLRTSYRSFPEGTVFVVVVDPGVGGARQGLAIRTAHYFFVGPDNGVLVPATKEDGIGSVRKIEIEPLSRTFHGRDVFAKAGAKIHLGKFDGLGKETEIKEDLSFHQDGRIGEVVRIDRFGNIITNLPSDNATSYRMRRGSEAWDLPFFPTYAEAGPGQLFVIEGSAGTLEIAVKGGSAQERLRFTVGDRVHIVKRG